MLLAIVWSSHRQQPAAIWMNALAADIVPSPTLVPQSALSKNVRQGLTTAGWKSVARNFFRAPYVHVVFTLPRHLAPLALHQNKKVVYDLLFRTSAETLLEIAGDPQHLGAEIGFFSVLHHWSQKLDLHPHVHCVV